MNKPRILIKLGGAALENTTTLELVTEAIQAHREKGYQVILVHGGGPAINSELRKLGITWEFIAGQRVTTPQMMDVIEYTLAGTVNRRLSHHFKQHGLPVRGISGAQHEILLCSQASAVLGQVGKIESVNTRWLELLLAQGTIPVLAPLGTDASKARFNINADWAAAHLAAALGAEQLLFLTDQFGIMDEEGKIISTVTASGLENMIEVKVVSGGMLTKARAVLHALHSGIRNVRITSPQKMSEGTTCIQNLVQEEEHHVAI
jgi:acetylglutamate kinase